MIRILRIIEYIYEDEETAEDDMSRWNAPAIGIIPRLNSKKRIRSTIIQDLDARFENAAADTD